jgi:ketol-acid reductoisomerase
MAAELRFESEIFPAERVPGLGGEWIVRGGRHLFRELPRALSGVKQIGVIGWGSQAPAQALNLRESLGDAPIRVAVGLRAGSESLAKARAAGFREAEGTLGDMFEVILGSELILLLISDAAQAELFDAIFGALRPGTTLGLSHGFLLAHLQTLGRSFPDDIDVVGVCPKGMGPSVRRLYQQGRESDGAGISASVAIHRDVTGRATDRALAWAIGIGAPYCFRTTLEWEYRSDIAGERGVLVGGVHGIVESLYRYLRSRGLECREAFTYSCESITGPISRTISRSGLVGLYRALAPADRELFERAYSAAYLPAREILVEIYDEVASGNEIRSVVAAGRRLREYPLGSVEGTEMWRVGRQVRETRVEGEIPIHPIAAGVYCALMIAQIDELLARGHPRSEILNESVIEAVDSLNPYMHARGVAYLVDHCSLTARLGCRKWGPRFDSILTQRAYVALDAGAPADPERVAAFTGHEIHAALADCAALRSSVEIAVEPDAA